jgi:2-iminobutanoate/2-iminopropanoate deaminase
MSRRTIETEAAPAAVGPYSQAIVCDGWVFVSGQIPATSAGDLVVDDLAAATRQCVRNIAAVLAAAGATLEDVVKVTVFLTDLGGFETMNAAYREAFGDSPPARACVEVGRLPRDVPVEIEAIARVPQGSR